MKPKIVILSAFLTPFRSGAEACAEEVPLALVEQYDFTIVTARLRRDLPKKDLLQKRIPVVRIGFGCALDKWFFPFLAPFAVRKLKPQIIHAVLETFAGLALHFCKFLIPSARRVLTLQTTNRSFLKGVVTRSPHIVTAISSALVEIAEQLGRNNVIMIPNGIPTAAIRAAVDHSQKVPSRVLFVGRLEPMKGVDVLLQAFSALTPQPPSSEGRGGHPHLRIVGDGGQRATLEQLAKDLGIENRVTFLGHIPAPDVYKEFAEAEIFCGLSRSEALGNVFIEAQAAGCAVIGTNVGGIPDIVEDGKTGLLIPPDNPEVAVGAIRELLENPELRSRLVEAGKVNAEQYDWAHIAEQYAQLYES